MEIVENFDLTPWLSEFKPGVSCFSNNARWQTIRKAIIERDNYQCVLCGTNKKLVVHHLISRDNAGNDDASNLITLCTKHHGQLHSIRMNQFDSYEGNIVVDLSMLLRSISYKEEILEHEIHSITAIGNNALDLLNMFARRTSHIYDSGKYFNSKWIDKYNRLNVMLEQLASIIPTLKIIPRSRYA